MHKHNCQPNKHQAETLRSLAQSNLKGGVVSYLEDMVRSIIDIRSLDKVDEISIEGRKVAAEYIEQNLIERIKRLSNVHEGSDTEWE